MFFFGKKKKKKEEEEEDGNPVDAHPPQFGEAWEKLEAGFNRLVEFLEQPRRKKPFDHKEYSILYSTVVQMCTMRGASQGNATAYLYDKVTRRVEDYLVHRVIPQLEEVGKGELLFESVRRFRNHQVIVRYTAKVFSYLERYYTKMGRDDLRTLGMKLYRRIVFDSTRQNVCKALLELIHREREGELVSQSLIGDGIQFFLTMGLGDNLETYQTEFETIFLQQTQEFFKAKSQTWIGEHSVSQYLNIAERRIVEESRRSSYLHQTTVPKLRNIVQKELVTEHHDFILRSGFTKYLNESKEKSDDLYRMYRLFKSVSEVHEMSGVFGEYIHSRGIVVHRLHEENRSGIDYKSYTNSVLDLFDLFDQLVRDVFQSDPNFRKALNDSFNKITNNDLYNHKQNCKQSFSELLSLYCDHIIRSGNKLFGGEQAMDSLFDRLVRLFMYVEDKDFFSEIHRRLMSRRLLRSENVNVERERALVTKLKMRCDNAITHKLEGMLKDLALSNEIRDKYKRYLQSEFRQNEIEFVPNVLTISYWPTFKPDLLQLPPNVVSLFKDFEKYYESQTEEKQLRWIHSMGTTQVIANLRKGRTYILSMTSYQAAILLLFNSDEHFDLNELHKATNLEVDVVKSNLISLCGSRKLRIVIKKSGPKRINDECKFGANIRFKSDNTRIRIPEAVRLNRKRVDEVVMEERKNSIDAAIVRVMKSRQRLEHMKLVMEVSRQLSQHFAIDPSLVKKRIAALITREYIKRDDDDTKFYEYMA